MLVAVLLLAFSANVDDLVNKLGDDSYSVRESAEKELERIINFKIYKQLVKIDKKDPEAADRIRRIISRYEAKLKSLWAAIDLKGYLDYPLIDWGLPDGYRWNGFNKAAIVLTYKRIAMLYGARIDYSPIWQNFRTATELWIRDRIEIDFREAISVSENVEDFHRKMIEAMNNIQKDIDMMIKREKETYVEREMNNPFLQN